MRLLIIFLIYISRYVLAFYCLSELIQILIFHQKVQMLVTLVFVNFYIFSLNLAANLGVDVCGSFWKGTGNCSTMVKLYKMKSFVSV